MYIERLRLKNVRTFVDETLEFVHPDRTFRSSRRPDTNESPSLPKPRLPNVNLLLGDNGSGKSTVLRAIAMATLGPSFADSRLPILGLVRRGSGGQGGGTNGNDARLEADLLLHDQDRAPGKRLRAEFGLTRRGELERAVYFEGDPEVWDPVFESNNDAFFAVGYGTTRRVEAPESFDLAARSKLTFPRAQRLQGLFQESFSLVPLSIWLHGAWEGTLGEVKQVLNRLLKPTRCRFIGIPIEGGELVFEHGRVEIEFRDLSDGYRAFIGWVGDMLFHAWYKRPQSEKRKLVDLSGIVLVDEIDLLLHPRWQMKVISTVARALPRMQFILTSHSPLVAGSLEWMNIITLKLNSKSNSTHAERLKESIHGLDADQVLVSNFFRLSTTRAESKTRQLDNLTLKASLGDDRAAELLIAKLAEGMEETE